MARSKPLEVEASLSDDKIRWPTRKKFNPATGKEEDSLVPEVIATVSTDAGPKTIVLARNRMGPCEIATDDGGVEYIRIQKGHGGWSLGSVSPR